MSGFSDELYAAAPAQTQAEEWAFWAPHCGFSSWGMRRPAGRQSTECYTPKQSAPAQAEADVPHREQVGDPVVLSPPHQLHIPAIVGIARTNFAIASRLCLNFWSGFSYLHLSPIAELEREAATHFVIQTSAKCIFVSSDWFLHFFFSQQRRAEEVEGAPRNARSWVKSVFSSRGLLKVF